MPLPMKNESFQYPNAKERVFQTLSEWLVDGTLRPGERILEDELSKYFGLSRTPIREALQMLAEKGLIDILPSKGTRVAPIRVEDMRQIYPLLANLQSYAVKLAAGRVDSTVILDLEEKNAILAEKIRQGDTRKILDADLAFHQVILDLTQNQYLQNFISELTIHTWRVELNFFRQTNTHSTSVEEHMQIINALRSSDFEEASKAVERNWMLALNYLNEINPEDL